MLQANEAWIAMFRRIPVNLHDNLVLGLATGAEMVIQKIVRLEPDFMILRARLAGTQDAGRLIMVPYGQLTFVALMQILKDPEIEAIFGKSAPHPVLDTPMTAVGEATPAAPSPQNTTSPPAEEAAAPKKPDQASKTALLAKLRDRLNSK